MLAWRKVREAERRPAGREGTRRTTETRLTERSEEFVSESDKFRIQMWGKLIIFISLEGIAALIRNIYNNYILITKYDSVISIFVSLLDQDFLS